MNKLVLLIFCSLSFCAMAKNVAIVKLFRGKAQVIDSKLKQKNIFKGMWINEGDIIKTSKKSFVRLSFIDKSTVNVGPVSQLKVEKFSKNEAGVLDVIQGKIRAKVTKDYLEMDKEKSKLFVKSKAAVMGIRGTDFIYSVGNNSKEGATAILFEGSVVFSKRSLNDRSDLETIVNRGRRIKPGNFSVVTKDLAKPTIPVKLNKKQYKALQRDVNFSSKSVSNKKHEMNTKLPEGISGDVVSSNESSIKESIAKDLSIKVAPQKNVADESNSMKFKSSEDGVQPAQGSIIVLDANTIIPMDKNAKFDQNTKEWRNSEFHIDANGQIMAPEGVAIQDDGSIMKMQGDKKVIVEIDMNNMNEVQISSTTDKKPKVKDVKNSEVSSANGTDWYQPPSQANTPTHLQNQQGSNASGFTPTRFTFTKE